MPLSKAAQRSSPLCRVVTWQGRIQLWKSLTHFNNNHGLAACNVSVNEKDDDPACSTWSSESVEYREYSGSGMGATLSTHIKERLIEGKWEAVTMRVNEGRCAHGFLPVCTLAPPVSLPDVTTCQLQQFTVRIITPSALSQLLWALPAYTPHCYVGIIRYY